MFKKAFQITIAFGLLVGAYRGYVLGFASVTSQLSASRSRSNVPAVFVQSESKTSKEAARLGAEAFGKDHWTANKELGSRVYDASRGYFLYYQNYERLDGGKRIKLWPFAIIWNAKDGKSRKTAICKEAIIDLNEPLGIVKPNSSAMQIVHAKLIGDVRIRDDKGTVRDPSDDLFVGPLTQIEYDEPSSRIYTASDMEIRDRNLVATSRGLNIDLRKPAGAVQGGGPGFEAKTATLLANVHVVVRNVGASGILPGTAKGASDGKPTPLDARCTGELRIDFPVKVPPFNPKLVGPPQFEGPTLAVLNQNVQVIRGVFDPNRPKQDDDQTRKEFDQLDSDILRLTLVPTLKQPAQVSPSQLAAVAVGASVAPSSRTLAGLGAGAMPSPDGPLTELGLSEANAVGHAVWIQVNTQGLVARCNELIYKKLAPFAPDETYLRGDSAKQLYVQKLDPIDPAKPDAPRSLTTIFALDAKIFDDGKSGSASTIVARGPGRYESRPTRDKPVDRSAWWQDELIVRSDPTSPGVEPRRKITLTGQPKLVDHAKGMTLEAKRSVVASMKPKAQGVAAKPAAPGATGSESMQLEWMQARDSVVLTSPGKILTARDQLDATFEDEQNPVIAARPAAPANAIANPFGPTVATKPAEPKKADALASAKPDDKSKADAKEKDKPAEPPVLVKAHRVWAKIRQRPNEVAPEILEAMLRGGVSFHQDPSPGKARGTDVTGEAVDVFNQGDGLMKFVNYWQTPAAQAQNARLVKNGAPEAKAPLAKIITDERYIEGQEICFDQKADQGWVRGEGKIIQLVERGMLNQKSKDDPKAGEKRLVIDARDVANAKEKLPKVPFTVRWTNDMHFYGQSKDPKGRPAGKAEFRGNVRAETEDAIIVCDELDTYTDRVVKLDKAVSPIKPAVGAAPAPRINDEDIAEADDTTKPEIAYLDARSKSLEKPVIIIYARRDAATKEKIDQQRIQGQQVLYDKRSGEFDIPTPGLVYLWRRGKADIKDKPRDNSNLARGAAAIPIAGRDPKASASPALGPWEATKIVFRDRMKGRFGLGQDHDQTEPRIADFYGGVKAMTAGVLNPDNGFDFDRPPADAKSLTASALRIVEFPPAPDAPKGTPAEHWMTAEGRAHANDATHTIAGDLITYTSEHDLFYVYGLNGSDIVIMDQKNPGQAYSNARGKSARYNHKTGEAQLIDPSTVTYFDGEGSRPSPGKPSSGNGTPTRKPRPALRPPPASSMERKGFGGR